MSSENIDIDVYNQKLKEILKFKCSDEIFKNLKNLTYLSGGGFGKIYTVIFNNKKYILKRFKIYEADKNGNIDQYKSIIIDEIYYLLKVINCDRICKLFCIANRTIGEVNFDNFEFDVVMQYCGESIDEKMKEKINIDIISKWIEDLLDAIKCMHDNKIAHLDIKPDNTIIDDKNRLKVIDLGISKEFSKLSKLKSFMGTPGHMAPEIVPQNYPNWKPVYTNKVDIYAIGDFIERVVELFENSKYDELKKDYQYNKIFKPKIEEYYQTLKSRSPNDRPDIDEAIAIFRRNFTQQYPKALPFRPKQERIIEESEDEDESEEEEEKEKEDKRYTFSIEEWRKRRLEELRKGN